ncbi:MAG: cell wall hydrolase, partial [Lachnospiraceae bacterium]|nr:cell wall hydrolase [Lachnospiraceae bacterium]
DTVVDDEWSNRLMANVDDYLSIRSDASAEAEVVGKLYKGDVAEVLNAGEEWTEITSGNVTGYVSNEYCVLANDAKELAAKVCDTKAKSLTGGLRVRETASEDGAVLTVMAEGDTAKVNLDADVVDGWVAVSYSGNEGYVKAEYAEVAVEYGEAISIEEEQEILAAQKAEEEKAHASQTTSTTTTQNAAVAASYDDVTLLAALIQCEAGNECYEGQLAVGAVVVNRLHSGAYGNSIYSVIYAPYQFGPARTGAVASVAASGPSASCRQAAQEALNGVSNIGGCTCFHRNDGRAGIVIGNHVFY